ncbi:hypothetical protein MDAP_001065 [Mitosporidium daphniae]
MLGFDACLEGLRLSLGASLCRDLPQHSKILCNSNEIFEQLSSIIKKAPKLCRSHVDQANALLIATRYIDSLLQITEAPKRSSQWGVYTDMLLGSIQYSLISLNSSMVNPIQFPGFDHVLEKIPDNSYVRTEFLFLLTLDSQTMRKKMLPMANSLSVIIDHFCNAQTFPVSIQLEKILLLLRNVHCYLMSALGPENMQFLLPIFKDVYDLFEIIVLKFVDIFPNISAFVSEIFSATKNCALRASEFEPFRLAQFALIFNISSHLSIEFSKSLFCELITTLLCPDNYRSMQIAQLKLLTSLMMGLPPVEAWFPLDNLLKFEAFLTASMLDIANEAFFNENFVCALGELYLCSPFLLSRSGSLFVQLIENSIFLTLSVKSLWRLKFRDAIHPRRQSRAYHRLGSLDPHPANTDDCSGAENKLGSEHIDTSAAVTTGGIAPLDNQICSSSAATENRHEKVSELSLREPFLSNAAIAKDPASKDSASEMSDADYSLVTDVV